VTGPSPGSRTSELTGCSMPLTDRRTTLPGRCAGDPRGVGDAVGDGAPALGVGDVPLSVELVPHADTTSTSATSTPLMHDIVAELRLAVM
jgi:hypothetical protein